jgi:hypothetical protein
MWNWQFCGWISLVVLVLNCLAMPLACIRPSHTICTESLAMLQKQDTLSLSLLIDSVPQSASQYHTPTLCKKNQNAYSHWSSFRKFPELVYYTEISNPTSLYSTFHSE